MKHIGILGGTFDPPHQGHLIMAELVRHDMQLDEIWFIPAHLPPHKQEAMVSSRDRLAMVERAIDSNSLFKVCDTELTRKGTSYTVDTMKHLTGEYPDDQFYFIIGADMVDHLPEWNRIDELERMVQFVGVKRPGYRFDTDLSVHSVEAPLIEISSSLIRNRLSNGETVRYLTPDSVHDYIKEHRLYESDQG